MATMSDDKIKSIVGQQIRVSLGYQGGKLAQERLKNQRIYNGEPLGNERTGRSQIVLKDVQNTVEQIIPSLMKVFASTDDVIEFQPQRPQDEDTAKLITDYVNYVFTKQNDGYEVYRTWFRDALINKNGFVKVYRDESIKETVDEYNDLSPDALMLILSDPTKEVSGEMTATETVDPETQQPTTTFSGNIKTIDKKSYTRVVPVPADEVLVSRRATSLKNCDFVCHRVRRTKTDLLELGFTKTQVENLPFDYEHEFNQERIERFKDTDEFPMDTREDDAMRDIWLNEVYIKLDVNGDGKAEWKKITAAGDNCNEILEVEDCDGHPFIDLTPVPIPHAMFGHSIVDQAGDTQILRTTLIRQVLDNLYISNTPRIGYVKGQVSVEDLMNPSPGRPIAMETPESILPISIPFTAGQTMPILDWTQQLMEQRTGVSNVSQGLDPNLLQSQTATLANIASNASNQRIELIAREFAETGVKRMFLKILELECKYQDKDVTVKLGDQWQTFNPTMWKTTFDVTVNVGLGTNNKDQNLAHLQSILQIQAQAIQQQGGVNGPLVTLPNVYNTVAKIAQNAGFKNADMFFNNPAKSPQQPPAPPAPDPTVMVAQAQVQQMQAQMQLEQQKLQLEAQKLQLEAHKQDANNQLQLQQEQSKFALEQEKMMIEKQLKEQELNAKIQNEQAKIYADVMMKSAEMHLDHQISKADIFGGHLVNAAKVSADAYNNDPANQPPTTTGV